MTSPGRSDFADTVAVRVAFWAASSRRRVVATAGTTTRRTSWSCSANSSAAAASARNRCDPPVIALTVMTPATSSASMLLPTIADAAAPTARIGVNGSASSTRVAASQPRQVGRRVRAAAPAPGCRTGRRGGDARTASPVSTANGRAPPASRENTISGSSACQAVSGCGVGSGSRSTLAAEKVPAINAVAAAALTGLSKRRKLNGLWSGVLLTGDQQQPGQRGAALGKVHRRFTGRTGYRDRGQDPHRIGQVGAGDDVRRPGRGRAWIIKGHTDIGDGQCGQAYRSTRSRGAMR